MPEVLKRVQTITNKELIFYGFDLMDKQKLDEIFKKYNFVAVLHFAGLKSVTESIQKPIEYYEINLGSMFAHLKRYLLFVCYVQNLIFISPEYFIKGIGGWGKRLVLFFYLI